MKADGLIGMVLGTCTLQELIGQGAMGAVFLAQQSRPRRQVAVKVLLPMFSLGPDQQIAFLERFRRETDVVASLEHSNIMPVHEYGERNGLAYLVMPYVDGGTLRDEMEREGQLPLEKVVFYLEQMAAALDFAHEQGVIHRDIKPANILLRREGRLMLTDFGLVKIIAEDQRTNSRLTGVGMPLGTPDYMAPEQAIGVDVDARADLYSLGVMLYHMVTGSVPFKGDMPMQVAMQHVHVPPPSPRLLRPDLPPAAEQVILRALAKRPADRYGRVLDLATAFRLALSTSGILLPDFSGLLAPGVLTNMHLFTPHSLLDPAWQGPSTVGGIAQGDAALAYGMASSPPQANGNMPRNDIVGKTSMPMPSLASFLPRNTPLPDPMPAPPAVTPSATKNGPRPGLGHKLNLRRPSDASAVWPLTPNPPLEAETQTGAAKQPATRLDPFPSSEEMPTSSFAQPSASSTMGASGLRSSLTRPSGNSGLRSFTPALQQAENGQFNAGPGGTGLFSPPPAPVAGNPTRVLRNSTTQQLSTSSTQQLTGALVLGKVEMSESSNTSMMKLAQATKVIQVPVAGQPGRYLTGLLPVLEEPKPALPPQIASRVEALNNRLQGRLKLVLLVAAVLLILFSSFAFWLAQSNSQVVANNNLPATPDLFATATARVSATASANTIVSDSLNGSSGNIHNWPLADHGPQIYTFKNGTYHITANDPHPAIALLQDVSMPNSFVYSLTMQAVRGDEGSINNRFGMIVRYNPVTKHGKNYATFYCFEVSNINGGEYQFLKYDDRSYMAWTKLWPSPQDTLHYGNEYHFGHGANSKNTFKVIVNGDKFAFVVNGKQVGTAQDGTLAKGQVGMFVNLQGTEVAFSNLALTYN